jgi:hypothetical protein
MRQPVPARTLAHVAGMSDPATQDRAVEVLVADIDRDIIAVLSSDDAVSEILRMTPSGRDYTPGRAVRQALRWQPFGAERSES